ncbi:MAG TPA: acyl-CoA dehydrogenase [Myxococcales bacterium]|jgi:alkylation response protein AidB-like acyl-CoA dehydrogenase|nr:acyl-CoA dehydrogenase [Myxococcales bacterium]HIM02880.1 acyl-CoA dehydrogenase [Myxococcales bacterium]
MDLNLSPDALKFRDELRAWLDVNLERSYTEEVLAPNADEDSLVEVRRQFQKKLNDAGYLGMGWPTEWGGRGATQVEEAILRAELAAVDAPQSPNALGIGLCAPALIHHGTEEQRNRFLPKMLSCDEIWCQGFSEPGAGSDLAGIRTKAEPDGDDYRITGQKVWTTLGPWSNWIFVLARTDMDDRHGGITFFLMPIDQPGVEMRALKQISGESEFGEVFFDNALAKREHIVGKIGEGWRIAMTVLGFERGGSTLLPSAEFGHQLDCLVDAVRTNGDLERPDVREKLGNLIVENEVLRANGMRTLANVAQDLPPGPESSIDKIFWSEFHQRMTDTAVELMGPQGLLALRSPGARTDVHWMREFLWARAGTIYSGSSEIQRNIIAKRVLQMPTK